MADVELPGAIIEIPYIPAKLSSLTGTTGANQTHPMSAALNAIAFMLVCPKAGDLESVSFLFPTITTGDDLKISFQDFNVTTGDPDEVADQFRVKTIITGDAGNVLNSGIISSDGTDVGTKRTVTKGQKIYVLFEFDSRVAGNMLMSTGIDPAAGFEGYPAVKTRSTTSWSEFLQVNYPNLMLHYDDGITPVVGCYPYKSFGSQNYNTGTTPDEAGSKFQLPFSGTCIGVTAYYSPSSLVTWQIENAGGSILAGPATFHFEQDSVALVQRRIFWDTEVTLAKDTPYYLVMTPTTAANKLFRWINLENSGDLASWPGGANWVFVERTDLGAWTETDTKKLPFSLIMSGFSDGAGAAPTCNFAGLVNGTRVKPLAGA